MDVKQLREVAKQRRVHGYGKMSKTKLIAAVRETERQRKISDFFKPLKVAVASLLDSPVPDLQEPVLQPIKVTFAERIKNKLSKYKADFIRRAEVVKSEIDSLTDWLNDQVRKQVVKPVNERLEAFKSKINKLYSRKDTFEIEESKSALKKFAVQYIIKGKSGYDPKRFLSMVKESVENLLKNNSQTKVKMILTCMMERTDIKTGDVVSQVADFHSNITVNLEGTDVSELYESAVDKMLESMANFQRLGSNWLFASIVHLAIHTVKYEPIRGSSYIELPKKLADKKAIVNLKNKDNECFKWAVTRALNPVGKNAERITNELREQAKLLNWTGLEFPMSVKHIGKFEKQNDDVAVNVFGYETEWKKGYVYPLSNSKLQRVHVVNLMLISDGEKNHYCWIKDLSRLINSQKADNGHKQYVCLRCLNCFSSPTALENHEGYCKSNDIVKVEMPVKGTSLEFDKFHKKMRVPFVVYADFESFIKPIDTCQSDPSRPYTAQYQHHTPSSFCYYIKCFDDKLYSSKLVTFTIEKDDDDVVRAFIASLESNVKDIYDKFFKFPKKMIWTDVEREKFNAATNCHICGENFKDKNNFNHVHVTRTINYFGGARKCMLCNVEMDDFTKVRDHCHITGEFRGAAHSLCNLRYKIPSFIPVVFHNLSGYDSHLFIKKLAGENREDISCIPMNEEKYISISRQVIVDEWEKKEEETDKVKKIKVTRDLRFIDSLRFMPSSLDALSKNLSKEQCKNVGARYSGRQLDLLLRKGVYPYEYVDSLERLDETQLPLRSAFYSRLNDSGISEEDYEHAQTVWKEFNCKTLRDYHDLYNVSDVLLLADIFENFRDVCMQNYELDPAWYFTSPGLAWDAALKTTKVKLELLSDSDMLLMFEKGIRGGVATISNRYAAANNKYMGDKYDPGLPSKYITYLDANNLYGWAMSKPLPTHGFEWMTEAELENWKNFSCILEVDMEYPTGLHDLHNDYPLAPESLKVNRVDKLIPNLYNKTKYVIHCENLKMYESLGLKTTRVYRGIKFEESPWLKKYIDLNTSLRAKAANNFEKDFFKLMNNSVFGKTIENIRKRVNIKLVTTQDSLRKLAAKPNYDSFTIFDENLVAVRMKHTKLTFNKPVYLGMSILDLSKTLMYDFHYNYVRSKYNNKARLLFTDTDSLCYEIETDDFFQDISGDIEAKFDTSEMPANHPSGIRTGVNKKVLGMFKDEACGKQIAEFVGLRAKLYSYKMHEGEEKKKCKGVKQVVVKKNITHDDYKQCLFSRKELMRSMNVIRSHYHEIYGKAVNKVALSANDDKRLITDDGIHTLAYGHYLADRQTDILG